MAMPLPWLRSSHGTGDLARHFEVQYIRAEGIRESPRMDGVLPAISVCKLCKQHSQNGIFQMTQYFPFLPLVRYDADIAPYLFGFVV
jgi:hypothetical protein